MSSRGKPDATGRSSGKIGGRRGEMLRPPRGEPWVWFTSEMLASDAWRSLGINARRFLDFLLIEHMNHGGAENGALLATYKQLEAFGLSANHISTAIEEAEESGLVDCERHGLRVASTYRLTWLPDKNWNPATDRWKQFQIQKSTPQTEGRLPPKQRADGANLPPKQRADATPQTEGPIYILEAERREHAAHADAASTSSGRKVASETPSKPLSKEAKPLAEKIRPISRPKSEATSASAPSPLKPLSEPLAEVIANLTAARARRQA